MKDFKKFADDNNLKVLDNFYISECDERRIKVDIIIKMNLIFDFNFLVQLDYSITQDIYMSIMTKMTQSIIV